MKRIQTHIQVLDCIPDGFPQQREKHLYPYLLGTLFSEELLQRKDVSLSFRKLYIPYRISTFSRHYGKLSGIVETQPQFRQYSMINSNGLYPLKQGQKYQETADGQGCNYLKNPSKTSTFQRRPLTVYVYKLPDERTKGLRSQRRSSPCIFQVVASLAICSFLVLCGLCVNCLKKNFSSVL